MKDKLQKLKDIYKRDAEIDAELEALYKKRQENGVYNTGDLEGEIMFDLIKRLDFKWSLRIGRDENFYLYETTRYGIDKIFDELKLLDVSKCFDIMDHWRCRQGGLVFRIDDNDLTIRAVEPENLNELVTFIKEVGADVNMEEVNKELKKKEDEYKAFKKLVETFQK